MSIVGGKRPYLVQGFRVGPACRSFGLPRPDSEASVDRERDRRARSSRRQPWYRLVRSLAPADANQREAESRAGSAGWTRASSAKEGHNALDAVPGTNEDPAGCDACPLPA